MSNRSDPNDDSWNDDDLAGANAAEFSDEAVPVVLAALAESIAGSATDEEEALDMCRDFANSEDLDPENYAALVALVENQTGWDLGEDSDRY